MRTIRTGLSGLFLGALYLLILPGAGHVQTAAAQTYNLQPESKLWIDGTSNKSDFTVHAAEMKATLNLGEGVAPTSLKISIPSAEIKSDQSTIMDRLMHDALKVSEHPTISYELTEAGASSASAPTLKTKGRLTLAGVTKTIDMDVKGERTGSGALRYTGSTPLKMTDFGIQPPVAMFGALRTADDVTVSFDVLFAPSK